MDSGGAVENFVDGVKVSEGPNFFEDGEDGENCQ